MGSRGRGRKLEPGRALTRQRSVGQSPCIYHIRRAVDMIRARRTPTAASETTSGKSPRSGLGARTLEKSAPARSDYSVAENVEADKLAGFA
jgi:hypothetical protein